MLEVRSRDACVVLVHASNPHGLAWLRRVNEDGIDLNRNWIDFSRPPSSAAYEPFHDLLVPADWNGPAWRAATAQLLSRIAGAEARGFQTAVSSGQYTRPSVLPYGGTKPAWSSQRPGAILRDTIPATVRRLAVLGLHTGLGASGYGDPIVMPRTSAEGDRNRRARHRRMPAERRADVCGARVRYPSAAEGAHRASSRSLAGHFTRRRGIRADRDPQDHARCVLRRSARLTGHRLWPRRRSCVSRLSSAWAGAVGFMIALAQTRPISSRRSATPCRRNTP